jgi:hypothetical protein
MEHVQDKLRAEKDADWDVFMKSVEKRKKERGEDKEH